MDEVLVENIEVELGVWEDSDHEDKVSGSSQVHVSAVSEPSLTTQRARSSPAAGQRSHPSPRSGFATSREGGQRGRQHSVASVIAMYSPDIPTASPGHKSAAAVTDRAWSGSVPDDVESSLENYYTSIETEESVKCVVSSVLFCTVLIILVLVALLLNPQM